MADGHCMYFVKRKKRFCRMTVREGKRYCGEHQQDAAEPNDAGIVDKRVKCPLDPKHTCYQSKLTKHVIVCNVKRKLDAQPAFVVKGVNLSGEATVATSHVPLSQLDDAIVNTVIKKINSAYEQLPIFSTTILQHDTLKARLSETCGNNARKHLLQNASLLGHLEQAGLIQDDTCFIEFGAGKARLTYWLGQITKNRLNTCILLVDRSSHRHKSDNKLRREESCLKIKRVRADIADLQLNQIADIQSTKDKVGIAKHLCGAATDLALRCLVKSMNEEPRINVRGLVIAFCCHHKCEYSSYVGREYLQQSGFTADEFPVLCKIVSWATCGSRLKDAAKSQDDDVLNKRCDKEQDADGSPELLSERELIGGKAKTLLNWGRLVFLRSIGFKTELFYYVPTDVSLENMCIVAIQERSA